LNNLLALDSSSARSNFLTVYLTTGPAARIRWQEDYDRDYDNPGYLA